MRKVTSVTSYQCYQCYITSRSIVSDIFLINQTRTPAAPVFILECADFGEASSDGDTVRPCVAAGPSGLNIKQTHHDQGIQLVKV